MSEVSRLAEQHVSEWDANLRRIDELMERARKARAAASQAPPEFDSQLAQLRTDRERIVRVIEDLRRQPFETWPDEAIHEPGLRGTLKAIGEQLEQLLTAVFARP